MHAEPIAPPHAFHAEGPCWWPEWGGLKYVDMMAGDVLSPRGDGGVDRVHVGTVAAALRPRRDGGAIIGVERGFALAQQPDLTDATALPEVWSDPAVRFNDGGCDPAGNFYCGTMAYDQHTGGASMYLHTTGGQTTQVLTDLTISNGIAWSPDGSLAYLNDTPTHQVSVFDWTPEDGLTGRRLFARLPDSEPGDPDGLCMDADGGVWIALYGGSAVHRYDPDGSRSVVIDLPVTNVTACTFGGADLRTLFITTTRENVPDGEQPLAGAVFSCSPGVTGLATRPFGA